MITYDDIISNADSISKDFMSTVPTSIKSTASTNFHNKKVRYKMDCYILNTVLLVIILLLTIAIIYYYYAKQKRIDPLTI